MKSALRFTSADDRMSDLIQIYVERDIADGIGLGQLVSEFFRVCIKTAETITVSCNLSYSRPKYFRGFNANSETSCIFVATAKPPRLSVFGAVQTAQCKWRNASGAT